MRRAGARGFSLLEVLVALAVLALSLGVLLQSFGSGARAATTTDRYAQALALAEERLALSDIGREARAGVTQGARGEFAWQLEIAPYAEVGEARVSGWVPHVVRAIVTWRDGSSERRVQLDSLRLLAR
jgi:general secretion pathway protein I